MFFLFVATHVVLIVGGIVGHVPELTTTAAAVAGGFRGGASTLGLAGMVMLLFHAFSLGGGTYTGIEAVSNGIPVMRHPQAQTAQRTMRYMAASLAFTATGLLVCYLLWDIRPVDGKTMNAVLVERRSTGWMLGPVFVYATMLSAAALLVVAAQAGFVDGPRVLANMALDSWVPRRFASLSERLTAQNGIVLVGGAALAALLYTRGAVGVLVVMYSINVFLTFSLSLLGMTIDTLGRRREERRWRRRLALFAFGLGLCVTILCITVVEKFGQGGWITLAVTASVTVLCLLTRRHYSAVAAAVNRTFAGLDRVPGVAVAETHQLDPTRPTAVMLVTSFGGLGMHTLLNAMRAFPGHFRNVVFVSVGVIDSGGFKGAESLDALRAQTEAMLARYTEAARSMGLAATHRLAIGTDPVEEAERLCRAVAVEFPGATFIAGHLLFARQTWAQRLLHNETAYAIQRRLQWAGLNMMILPARIG